MKILKKWRLASALGLALLLSSPCLSESTETSEAKSTSTKEREATLAEQKPLTSPALLHGKALAQQHCTRCHLLPLPNDLPRRSWPMVMSWMGIYTGTLPKESFPHPSLVNPALIPPKPLMSEADLLAVGRYYHAGAGIEPAPKTLPAQSKIFEIEDFGSLREQGLVSSVTLDHENVLHVGEALDRMVYKFDLSGSLIAKTGPLNSAVVGMVRANGHDYYIEIGYLLKDGNLGRLLQILENGELKAHGKFPRLAHARPIDVNGDGIDELLLSAFGYRKGALMLARLGNNGEIAQTAELVPMRGFIDAKTIDLEGDGDQDFLALFSNGRQELHAFINDGKGQFSNRPVFSTRPSWGFTGFELADLDEDGHLDIVAHSGNNAEHQDPPIRPYHGLYFFKGNGKGTFKELGVAFQPLPGATVVRTGDFDLDGKIDLVAGSSSTDWRADSSQGVVLFKNLGEFKFETTLLSKTPTIALEIADVDEDGDLDLFVGLFPSKIFPSPNAEHQARREVESKKTSTLRLFRNTTK